MPLNRSALPVAAALLASGLLAACSAGATLVLTDAQFDWCQDHFWDGMDAAQDNRDDPTQWFFTHMGTRTDPDTVRVCASAWDKRDHP